MRAQLRADNKLHDVRLETGDVVFRTVPKGPRLPKHLLPEPSKGPYVVSSQPTTTSVVLRGVESDESVDGGAAIPLDQILAGPWRARMDFDPDSEVRVVGVMLRREGAFAGVGTMHSGFKAGRRTGWGPLHMGSYVAYQTVNQGPESRQLTVGKVFINNSTGKSSVSCCSLIAATGKELG